MGAFYTNILLYGTNQKQVEQYLAQVSQTAYVSPTISRFTVVYDKETSYQDELTLTSLASGLSGSLKCAALAALIHDSDVFMYWLFEAGNLIDRYSSWPEYFGTHAESLSSGDAKRLCAAFDVNSASEEVARVFETVRSVYRDDSQPQDYLLAEDIHRKLAKALGVPSFAAYSAYGYDYTEIGEGPKEPDHAASDVLFKGTGRFIVELRSAQPTGDEDGHILAARLRSLGVDAMLERNTGQCVQLRLEGAVKPSRIPTFIWRRRTFELHLVALDQSLLLPSHYPKGFPGLDKAFNPRAMTGDLTDFFLGPTPASLQPLIQSVDPGPEYVAVPQRSYLVGNKYQAVLIEANALVQTGDIVSARAESALHGTYNVSVTLGEAACQRLSRISVSSPRRMAFLVDGVVEAAPLFAGYPGGRELRAKTATTAEDAQLLAAALNQPELASDWLVEAVHAIP